MTASTLTDTNAIACPKCGGQMYDNRGTKKNAKQPDFKCKNYRVCDGVIWPPKPKIQPYPPILHNAAAEDAAELAGKIGQPERPKMREAYRDLTKWVISDIVPLYKNQIDASVVASITATLFIQACKFGKVE